MKVKIYQDRQTMGAGAAAEAGELIRSALTDRQEARILVATGASQFDFLSSLTAISGIEWGRVTVFNLDDYVGLTENHPASFRKYLRERLIDVVGIGTHHLLAPENGALSECRRVGALLQKAPVDVAFVGIGENGHLAFNDPPADFETEEPYILVNLDDRCRQQQLGEGWFHSIDEVPRKAISISVRQILKSRFILCVVPEARKAPAVRDTIEGKVTPMVPASILKQHADATIYLDRDSASLLSQASINKFGTQGDRSE